MTYRYWFAQIEVVVGAADEAAAEIGACEVVVEALGEAAVQVSVEAFAVGAFVELVVGAVAVPEAAAVWAVFYISLLIDKLYDALAESSVLLAFPDPLQRVYVGFSVHFLVEVEVAVGGCQA